ncbi:MAG: DNA primase [Gammaproteobacteria bacterium]|nr:DNA primase [Gammaproteobacteria bacterium]MDH5730404.1 DNA primase [Gammaproteobacteria bacterium]
MANRIPQHFIDELLSRVDIVDAIESRIPLKKAGREYKACCPFHQEKTPSFTVSSEKQFYHCFGCGAHGTVISFLMEYDHLGFIDAVKELAQLAGMSLPVLEHQVAKVESEIDLFELLEKVVRFYRQQLSKHPQRQKAVDYLKQRGLSGELAAQFEIGFAPPGWNNLSQVLGQDHNLTKALFETGMLIKNDDGRSYDRFRDRIMFPIRDRRGRVVGFGGRVMAQEEPKYLNSPETPIFHKGQELYGLYQARKQLRELPQVLVVEGYMDVVSLAQHGLHYAVAALGTALTESHIRQLARHSQQVIFCFDADAAGYKAAWRALENALPLTELGVEYRFLFLPQGHDPDSFVREFGLQALLSKIKTAESLSNFFFDFLRKKADMRGIEGRARLVGLAQPLIKNIPAGAYQNLMLTQLADISGVTTNILTGGSEVKPVGFKSQPQRTQSQRQVHAAPSPVRQAIQLLVHFPRLAAETGDLPDFQQAEFAGLDLLFELFEFVRERPHSNSGLILEHWRDREAFKYLLKLTRQTPQVPITGLQQQFKDTLQRIVQAGIEQQTDRLIQKAQSQGLSREEMQQMKSMIELSKQNFIGQDLNS